MKQIPLLTPRDIEVKIKQCLKSGAIALLYKTARVDYRILDEVYGPLGWQIDYTEIKGNLYCTISLWDEDKKQWVRKTNCGIESREDGEGNEKKGEASDAAKRAGFVVGVGAELYSSPFIFLEVATADDGHGKYKLADKSANYVVKSIEYDPKTRDIVSLVIINEKSGVVVFDWKAPNVGKEPKKDSKKEPKKDKFPEDTVEKSEAPNDTPAEKPSKAAKKDDKVNTPAATKDAADKADKNIKMNLADLIKNIGLIAKKISTANGTLKPYLDIVSDITGDPAFKCSRATEEQYDLVLKIYQTLVDKGYDN